MKALLDKVNSLLLNVFFVLINVFVFIKIIHALIDIFIRFKIFEMIAFILKK